MKTIKIYEPNIKEYTKSAVESIKSGMLSYHGKYITLTEKLLNKIFNIPYTILMCNGTCAVHCMFLAIKYKYPQITKIYVSNNSYIAAWNPIIYEYKISQIIPMKMDLNTCNIIEEENYIKSLDKNSCVLIVHNIGNIVNVPRLKRIRPDLIFVEDNCEGLFGIYENEFAGMSSSTFCSSCSFYANKIITSGEGGAFFTHNKEIYEYIKLIYSQGMSTTRYLHNLLAYNYRMTNIQAALIYDQLIDYLKIIENKKKIFNNYDRLFKNIINTNNKVTLVKINRNTERAPWIYCIRLINNDLTRPEIISLFDKNSIEIRPFFYPINYHKHLTSIDINDPISIQLSNEYILIPSSPDLTLDEQKYIVNFINNNFNNQNINSLHQYEYSGLEETLINIFDGLSLDYINNVLEIGTSDGGVSTEIIYNYFINKKHKINFFSYEGDTNIFNIAYKRWKNVENIKIINKFFSNKEDIKNITIPDIKPTDPNLEHYLKTYKKTLLNSNYEDTINYKPDIIFIDSWRYSHSSIVKKCLEFTDDSTLFIMEDDIDDFGELKLLEKRYNIINITKYQNNHNNWPYVTFNIKNTNNL